MHKALKPFLIIGGFWFLLLILVSGGFSSGLLSVTGHAVSDSETSFQWGLQSVSILVLLFTNLITVFFLARSHLGK